MVDTQAQIAGSSDHWTALYAGDCTLIIEFGDTIERAIVDQVNRLDALIHSAIDAEQLDGVLETVPTFRSLAVIYDPLVLPAQDLLAILTSMNTPAEVELEQEGAGSHWDLPVIYGESRGPDLPEVAQLTGLAIDDVIELHTSAVYTVYMLGFLPGYAFLGDTPEALHLPRRSEPRLRVPSGSVAIAKQLTGIYPWESPGGWHIVGNCPIPMFDAAQSPPALLKAGDRVSFSRIDQSEYDSLSEELAGATFERDRWVRTSQ